MMNLLAEKSNVIMGVQCIDYFIDSVKTTALSLAAQRTQLIMCPSASEMLH